MRLEFGFGTGTQSVEVCDDRLPESCTRMSHHPA